MLSWILDALLARFQVLPKNLALRFTLLPLIQLGLGQIVNFQLALMLKPALLKNFDLLEGVLAGLLASEGILVA